MSFTVFLGNLPVWVTADDIKSWLAADNLVADAVKVIRNPETQESKGFAFIEAPNQEEMNSIIRRFDRAPLEDRLLRANPAQPPKGRGQIVAPRPVPGWRSHTTCKRTSQHCRRQRQRPQNRSPTAFRIVCRQQRICGGAREGSLTGALLSILPLFPNLASLLYSSPRVPSPRSR